MLSSGARVAVWSDAAGVHAQQFEASGALVQGTVLVAAAATFSGVAPLPGGLYVVEFQTPEAVFAQVVSAEGGLVGAAVVVRTQEQVRQDRNHAGDRLSVGIVGSGLARQGVAPGEYEPAPGQGRDIGAGQGERERDWRAADDPRSRWRGGVGRKDLSPYFARIGRP